jgi:FkbM family methyltransferase
MVNMLRRAKTIVRTTFPTLWVHYSGFRSARETEMALLPNIVPRHLASIDIGANMGMYTRQLSKLTPRVHAFEPTREMARLLRKTSARNVIVHEVALSDRTGSAELHLPIIEGERATTRASLETMEGPQSGQTVAVRRLDDEIDEPIGFMKIDVEGHELAVLRGARATIETSRPIVMVECEERHNPGGLAELKKLFAAKAYYGYFYYGQRLLGIDQFDVSMHQTPSAPTYVNNFLFFPSSFTADSHDAGLSAH